MLIYGRRLYQAVSYSVQERSIVVLKHALYPGAGEWNDICDYRVYFPNCASGSRLGCLRQWSGRTRKMHVLSVAF